MESLGRIGCLLVFGIVVGAHVLFILYPPAAERIVQVLVLSLVLVSWCGIAVRGVLRRTAASAPARRC